ncbi:hypothetical protein PG999_009962 [Apiospora kogelbergensis]|uniref:Uncharacterized protein n=1 Tax=Apiospora kogelbergensis TaxID=1337665 RepID=A0AAW0QPX0_9PEZI
MMYLQHASGPFRRVLPRTQLAAGATNWAFKRFALAERPEKDKQKLTQAKALSTIDFLDRKHKAKFLTQSPEDLQAQVVPSLDLAIRKLEEKRAGPPQLSEDPDNSITATIDRLVPAIALPRSDGNTTATDSDIDPGLNYNATYIGEVFKLDQKSYTNAASYVRHDRYLFWAVPTELYRQTLTKELRYLFTRAPAATNIFNTFNTMELEDQRLVLEMSKQEGVGLEEFIQYQSALLAEYAATGADNKVENHKQTVQGYIDMKISAAEITAIFADALRDIPADELSWTKERLEEVLIPLIKSLFSMRPSSPETEEPWGFHLLRWFLFALQPGPAPIPSMVVLGKRETMNRIQKAIDSIACGPYAEEPLSAG